MIWKWRRKGAETAEADPAGPIELPREPEAEPVPEASVATQAPEVPWASEDVAWADESGTVRATLRSSGPCQREVSVEVSAGRVAEELQRALVALRGRARLPGFRQGKAPLPMVRQRYAEELNEDVKDRVVSATLAEILEGRQLFPITRPRLKKVEFAGEGPLSYVAEIEIEPEIPPFELRGLRGRRPRVEVNESDVEAEVNRLREALAEFDPVERQAQAGDVLLIDYDAREGEAAPEAGAEADSARRVTDLRVEVGTGMLLPEMDQGLMGAIAGSERAIEVRHPDDYPDPALAGKTIRLQVTVKDVSEKRLPALDDAFAARVSDETTMEGLRARIGQGVRQSREREAERILVHSLYDSLMMQAPFEVPPSIVRSAATELIRDLAGRLGADAPELRDARFQEATIRQAIREVKRMYLTREIARRESLEVSQDELGRRIQDLAAEMARARGVEDVAGVASVLGNEENRSRLLDRILEEKVVQLLREHAEVEEENAA